MGWRETRAGNQSGLHESLRRATWAPGMAGSAEVGRSSAAGTEASGLLQLMPFCGMRPVSALCPLLLRSEAISGPKEVTVWQ